MSDMSARPAIPHDKQPDSTIEASLPSMNDGTLPPDASSLSEPPEGNAVSQTRTRPATCRAIPCRRPIRRRCYPSR